MVGSDYVGKVVGWSSQAQGGFKSKEGVVLEYIPPNTPIKADIDLDYLSPVSKRARLLVNVKGRFYTPVGKSNGEFPNLKVVK